jgi:hypothetical protein
LISFVMHYLHISIAFSNHLSPVSIEGTAQRGNHILKLFWIEASRSLPRGKGCSHRQLPVAAMQGNVHHLHLNGIINTPARNLIAIVCQKRSYRYCQNRGMVCQVMAFG